MKVRERCSSPEETEALRRFVAGEPVVLGWRTTWLRMIRDGLPDHDFWLFDSHRLVRMHFADDDTLIGREPVTDPAEIVAANR